MINHLSAFSSRFAPIISEIGSERLSSLLVSMLKGLVPFDNAVIVQYHGGEKPMVH